MEKEQEMTFNSLGHSIKTFVLPKTLPQVAMSLQQQVIRIWWFGYGNTCTSKIPVGAIKSS